MFLACLHGLFGTRRSLWLIGKDILPVHTSLMYLYTSHLANKPKHISNILGMRTWSLWHV